MAEIESNQRKGCLGALWAVTQVLIGIVLIVTVPIGVVYLGVVNCGGKDLKPAPPPARELLYKSGACGYGSEPPAGSPSAFDAQPIEAGRWYPIGEPQFDKRSMDIVMKTPHAEGRSFEDAVHRTDLCVNWESGYFTLRPAIRFNCGGEFNSPEWAISCPTMTARPMNEAAETFGLSPEEIAALKK